MLGICNLSAQITASGSVGYENPKYDGEQPSKDIIFYYKDNISGTLRCDLFGNYYTWSKYNIAKKEWEDFSTLQEIPVSEHGGYKVKVSDSRNPRAYNDSIHCWLIVPNLTIEATVDRADCFYIWLNASADHVPPVYYNPADHEPYSVSYVFNWETSTEIVIPDKQQSIRIEAPYENTTYSVSVVDKFDEELTSEVYYEAIAVKAEFRAEILKADIPHEVHDSILFASAPLDMRFFDESLGNIGCLFWEIKGLEKRDRNLLEVFTEARLEKVILTVRNNNCIDYECEDSISISINVMASLLEFPNAFTPNGDGINDEFRCVYRSLNKYQISIINRWGRVVYTSTDPSKGWDGNVNGKPAPPGVYFYFAEAEGHNKLENGQFETHKKRGNVHLIRGK